MDKLTAIKIKYDDGTYSDEIPVSVLSENVEWDSTHTLVDVLGSIDVKVTGTIQDQISQLFNEKVSASAMQDYVTNSMPTYITNWLNTNVNPVGSAVVVDSSLTVSGAAADAKVTGDEVADLKSALDELNGGSINLLNPADFQQGKYLVVGGGLSDNANLTASGFFPVSGNTTYYFYRSDTYQVRVCFYTADSEAGYIYDSLTDISSGTSTFTTPATASYVRISTNKNMILDMGIYASDIRYYIPYQLRLNADISIENQIDNTLTNAKKAAPADAVGKLKNAIDALNGGSINLLNPTDFQQGKYIVAGGGLANNADLTVSGFFPVEENSEYYMYRSNTYDVRVAYYSTNDENGYIEMDSAISASTKTFTTRTGSKYVRISTNKNMILDMGIYASDIRYYIPYQLRLNADVSIENQIDKDLISANKASPANVVGAIKERVIFPEECVKYGDTDMIANERLDLSNGNIVQNSSGQVRTDFIPVNVGDYVQTCAIRNICLYDDEYQYLGYINLWTLNDAVTPPESWSGNYNVNITRIEAVNGVEPKYIRCWGRSDAYPPAITMLSDEPYKVVNLGDSIFGNNEKPWDLGTYIQNITGLKDANCGYGGTTARVIPSGNMSPLGLPSIVDCIVSEDFSSLQTPAYWRNLQEYRYSVPTLLFGMIDFSKIEVITIAYGTNDWNSDTPLDNTDNRLDTSTYKGGLRYAVENLQTKYPDITLIMLSPIYRYWSDSSDYSTVDRDSDGRTNLLGLKLIDYVTAMKEVADEYHLPYFNNYDNIGLNRYTAPTWLRDGTHLNRGIGVDKMGHIVAREVNQIY